MKTHLEAVMAARPVTWGFREVFSGVAVAALAVVGLWFFFSVTRGLPGTRSRLEDRDALLISAAFEIFFVAVAVWYAVVRGRGSFASLGFVRPKNGHPVVLAVVAWLMGLGLVAAWAFLVDRMGWEALRPSQKTKDLIGDGADLWLTFAVVAVVAPFCEEVFFRGFAYAGLRRSVGMFLGALLSAALFGIFHVDPAVFVPVFIFGIVLAWVYIQTGSIWPSMLAHALNNAVVLAIAASGVGT
jgi:membrane protease YdiL (CAAX protease family)